jgi:2',3'-cyclic-nucleotide 2'-phosphodiesterase (5'-nucleotidase family)
MFCLRLSVLRLAAVLSFAFAACQAPRPLLASHTYRNYEVDTSLLAPDSAITAMLRPYKKGVDTMMKVLIGYTDIPLTKAQPECLLGNFMADATLQAAKKIDPQTVAAIANYGGIRLDYLPPGQLSKGQMYELMPFDNMLTIVEITGVELQKLCDHMAKYKGWPVSGLTYTIKDKVAVDVRINGGPPNDFIYYKIAVSDYLARGGDNCDMLTYCRKRHTSVFIRDAMIGYVVAQSNMGKPLHPEIENRVKYAE